MHTHFILHFNIYISIDYIVTKKLCLYTINGYDEYNDDSKMSVYDLDKDDLDSHVELASKAQKSFLNGKGKGKSLNCYAYNN